MQMLLFIYILHSLNLTKGLDNAKLVLYRRKYSSGPLFLCVLTDMSPVKYKRNTIQKSLLTVSVKVRVLMQHMETINYSHF